LIANGDFSTWTDDNPDGWTVTGEDGVNNYVTESPVGSLRLVSDGTYIGISQSVGWNTGGLVKIAFDVINSVNRLTFEELAVKWLFNSNSLSPQIRTITNGNAGISIYRSGLGNVTDVTLDNVSVKKLTDVPVTGLHLMSTKNGTTRNMANVETGFNPNAIVGVKIYG
jgi:hypothetical protein